MLPKKKKKEKLCLDENIKHEAKPLFRKISVNMRHRLDQPSQQKLGPILQD